MWIMVVGCLVGCAFGYAVDSYCENWKERH